MPTSILPEARPSRINVLPEPLQVGEVVVDTYRVEEELGRGAMGIVYRAHDLWLDRPVALKIIAPTWHADSEADRKLRQEARALASVRSDHIVGIYAFGRHKGAFFFAMEYVKGSPLSDILETYASRGSALPEHRVATITARIAEGLYAVHEKGIIHRDVKPGNILIEDDTGRPVLVDFGLALPTEQFELGTFEGTPAYMAPEQAGLMGDGTPVGPWTDEYALACVAFEMLTGQAPYDKPTVLGVLQAHQFAPVPAASAVRAQAAAFDEVLMRGLAKDIHERFPSCRAFGDAMLGAASPKRSSSLPPSAEPPSMAPALRILTVDDDPAFGKLAAKAAELATKGTDVRIRMACSGKEALDIAKTEPPDLVLLDLDMPDLDGIETLSLLRAMPRAAHARVVVISGRVGPQERWRFTILGVREIVAKPVELRTLVEVLKKMTASAAAQQRAAGGAA